jgi:hypothetical protein
MALKLFYSYSTKDEELRDELEAHLSLLRRQGIVEEWHFRNIVAGRNFEDDIDKNLETADVVLLLVSADFLHSEYCWNREMKRALERQSLGEARVIPIIVRPCDWSDAPFAKLEALPRDGKPVTKWENRDEAWTDVAKGLKASIEEFINHSPASIDVGATTSELSAAIDHMELFSITSKLTPDSVVALITCVAMEDPSQVREAIAQLRDDFLHDPYIRRIVPSLEDLRKQGLRYRDDDPEIRSRVIDRLANLPFEGYACFAKRDYFGPLDDSGVSAKLFGRLFYERLRAYREREISINVSADSDPSIMETQNLVDALLRNIRDREGIVFARSPVVIAIEPDDACETLANYVFAITLKKLELPNSPEARTFEKIRSKMRLIHDLATDTFYSRDRQLP